MLDALGTCSEEDPNQAAPRPDRHACTTAD